MSKNLNLSISVDVNKLLEQIGAAAKSIINRNSYNEKYFDNNQGRWISCQSNGILYSMCYHKTKQHSATCEVHNNFTKNIGVPDKIVRSSKSEAPPGLWAIAYYDSGKLGGDKTYYNCW